MEENYLAKWLNGELSEAEEKAFRDTPEYHTYNRIAQTSAQLEAPAFDMEQALNRARSTQEATIGRDTGLGQNSNEEQNTNGGKVRTLSPMYRWMSAAAAVVLFVSVGWLYWNSLQPTVEAGLAEHKDVVLPDASEITLNAGSSLVYDSFTWEEDRRIELKGEAFFKVAKGKTFTVETSAGTVTVLGTQFNVVQRDGYFIVSCYEGLVRVEAGEMALELPAGEEFRILNGVSESLKIPAGEVPGWTQNESTFTSMPLSFVLQEFERQYNLTVTTRGIDQNLSFSGSFSNTNMDLALKSISTPLKMAYEVNGNNVLFYAENAP